MLVLFLRWGILNVKEETSQLLMFTEDFKFMTLFWVIDVKNPRQLFWHYVTEATWP